MSNSTKAKTYSLSNGITLVAEKMPNVQSVAVSLIVPIGAATDPLGFEGTAAILVEMFAKGAGAYNSRELSQAFEDLGAHRSSSSGVELSVFNVSLLGENIEQALRLLSTMILEPRFPTDELENVKSLALQDLRALEDEPASKVMVELAAKYYPSPLGRSQYGTVSGINAISIDSLREAYAKRFSPDGAILAVAGNFDWELLQACVVKYFSSWAGKKETPVIATTSRTNQAHHIALDSSQLQIALAYPSISYEHPKYYAAKVAVGLLSGGMAGRLFIEVREKRGLVYRVSASHSAIKGRAAIFAYAGTTPENGQETLDVMLKELRGLKFGITKDELARSLADMKSRLIIQSEMSSVRSSSIANDWWNLSRVRTVEEIKQGIEAVSIDAVVSYLEEFPVDPVTLVVLGSKPLELH